MAQRKIKTRSWYDRSVRREPEISFASVLKLPFPAERPEISRQGVVSIASSSSSERPCREVRAIRLSAAPLVPLLTAFSAGIAIDHLLDPCDAPTWINLALAAITVGCLALRRQLVSSLAIIAAILAAGGAWHHVCWNDRSPHDLSWSVTETPRPAWIQGVITEVMGTRTSPGYGTGDPDRVLSRIHLAITAISSGSRWQTAEGRAILTVSGDRTDLRAGQPIEAAGQLSTVSGPLNPGEFDYRTFLRTRGIFLRFSVDGPSGISVDPYGAEWPFTRLLGDLRAYCRTRLTAQLDDRTAPLASALILGQRDEIDPEINDAFARTGTTHLLAISGLQLQALAFFFAWVFRLLFIPRRPASVAVGAITVGYAVLVGLAPSVVRSAVMTLTFCLAAFVERPTRSANTLALAGFVTLACNPFYLFDVGCQLSFLAIAALIWLVPRARSLVQELKSGINAALHRPSQPIEELKKKFEPGWRKRFRWLTSWIAQMMLTSAVVWLAALPLVALRFHLASPIGILLNIPLIPLTTIAMILGATGLGLGMIWTPLGSLPILGAEMLLRLTEAIVRWGVSQRWGHCFVAGPSLSWVVAFYALLALAAVASWAADRGLRLGKRQTWLGVLWASVVLPLIPGWLLLGDGRAAAPRGDLLAVGHGLAVSLQLEDGYTILYDCGRLRDPRVGRR
ncbi:MAG: ComEC/Rec2 family competence protein, partial [Isosphaeraceae bacterium]